MIICAVVWESAGALEWTPLFRSYHRDGRLTSGMVSIEHCRPGNRLDAFSQETRIDPGGGGQLPGSAIHVVLLTLAGAAPTRTNKPAWVSPMVNPRCPGWSPSMQSYPPLGRHQATHPPKSIGRACRKPHLPARPPMEQIDPAIKDIQIVSGRDVTLPFTPASRVRRDIRKMRPAGQTKRSPGRPGCNDGLNKRYYR